MKRKAIYIGIAGITLLVFVTIIYILLFETSFRAVSYDGRSGASSTDWKSSDGMMVYEVTYYYSSEAEAQKELEKWLNGETIIEREKNPGLFSEVDERVVTAYYRFQSNEKSFRIIALENDQINIVSASSLEDALKFERSWIKLDF